MAILPQLKFTINYAPNLRGKNNEKRKTPSISTALFSPKILAFWLGVAIWRSILCLPYPILRHIGHGFGWLFSHLKVGKRRAAIARRNLELCFPDMPENERETILQGNLRSVGMAIIETGMAWFWSDSRIKKWSKVEGLHYLKENQKMELFSSVFIS